MPYCVGCQAGLDDDIETMTKVCVETLSSISNWDEIDLGGFLRRLIEVIKKGRISNVERNRLSGVLSRIQKASETRNEVLRLVGNTYVYLGIANRAMEAYDLALRNRGDDTTALNNKGVLLARVGDVKDAVECYDMAIEIDPENENAWFNKGKAYTRLKKPKAAAKCFKMVVEINPKNASAWNNLGVSLRMTGDIKEAIKCYNSALRVNKNYKWAWNNLGIAYLYKRKYDRAKEYFRKALMIDPEFKEAKEGLEACTS